ncbi:DUF892 family protein [Mucilaginibacter limnophilus]|uniref:DUF892 family protein n=1 Tax=Mucilaginibacter limnophilus TaxID=1932778 RepID=A0A3S2WW29_9SPHI|nr:DUF892 family protein [Mucilaginibacter limnophilus]RVT98043.1 DUF892 family protein [Mucilaginibacter limnophilus]
METNPLRNSLNEDMLKHVFVHNLNRLYFGKCYINAHINNLINKASFKALKLGLQEFSDDLKKQITRMHEIYKLLDEAPSDENCNPLKSIVRDNFCLDDQQDLPIITDTDITLYIQMLEHINITACNMLKRLAILLNYDKVGQLLVECCDESADNAHLFQLITAEYIG